jgi:SulP family sulfate permease
LSWSREAPTTVVLRLDRVPFIDATGLKRLESTMAAMGRRDVRVLLAGANLRVLRKLVRSGIVAREGATNYFGDLAGALAWLQREAA